MNFTLVILTCVFFGSKLFASSATTSVDVVVSATHKGFPPFSIEGEKENFSGIIPDILSLTLKNSSYSANAIYMPEKRMQFEIKRGNVDAVLSAIPWTKYPKNYVYSNPIITVRDVIFHHPSNPVNFSDLNHFVGESIGVVHGYTYDPTIEKLFAEKKISKIETRDEIALLNMIRHKRLKYALITERVGWWIAKKRNWSTELASSKNSIGEFEYRLLIHNKFKQLKNSFDKSLVKNSKGIQKIISAYR